MVMLLADRLAITVAPASAARVLGGSGTQRSSQISTPSTKPGRSSASNSRSVPNGARVPATAIVSPTRPTPEANCRAS